MSTHPIIKSKLTIPRSRANLVSRPRLVNRLNQGMSRRLTLISAAPGFGKTTLLVEWQSERGDQALPMAWLSLDEGDNDPMRFVSYLVAACQPLIPRTPAAARRRVSSPRTLVASTLAALTNGLADATSDVVLVLDDYHTITSEEVHDMVALLLNRLPSHVHVVIVTRVDPPLSVAQLRAADQLVEIRAADLSFTRAEAAHFLHEVMGLTLTSEQVAALNERTEGWITGLQLAGLALQGSKDVEGFIRNFAGSHRFVLDYFAEVFRQQPSSTQDFMLRTAVLDSLSATLCKAVTGNSESQATLEELEKTNLFIIPLDDTRTWYRYHSLFGEFLRSSLLQLHPDWRADLHRQASAWYAEHDQLFQAIDHALAAGDSQQAAIWIEQALPGMLLRGELVTMFRWLSALPEAVIHVRPRLGLMHTLGLAMMWRFDTIEDRLQEIEKAVSTAPEEAAPDKRALLSVSAALRTAVAAIHGDVARTDDLCQQTLKQLPENNAILQSLGLWTLGLANTLRGDTDVADRAFWQIIATSQPGTNVVAILGVYTLGYLEVAQGHLHQAQQIYHRGLELAIGEDGQAVPLASMAYLELGEIAHECNDAEEAVHLFQEGIDLSLGWGNSDLLVDGYLGVARVKLSQGDLEGVQMALKQLDQVSRQHGLAQRDLAELVACRVHLALARGDLESAGQWAKELAVCPENDGPIALHLYQDRDAALVRFLLAKNELERALVLLDQRIRKAQSAGLVGNAIKLMVLKALLYQKQSDGRQARIVLEQALTMGEPEGFCRVFVDEGEPMRQLLSAARPGLTQPLQAYASRLLATLGDPDAGSLPPIPVNSPGGLIEPLSERELDVLRLLATGRSSPQMAEQLGIAVSTVRSHLKHIYGKLEVDNRVHAVERAMKLELIDAPFARSSSP